MPLKKLHLEEVTILILIDGFLQYIYTTEIHSILKSHNPYFNRWFSAINLMFALAEVEK